MLIYFDCEFTDLDEDIKNIKLISAGFVTEKGQSFYIELNDNFMVSDCSPFVRKHVLPHLSLDVVGVKSITASVALHNWISDINCPVQFACDAPEYDWVLIKRLFDNSEIWPNNLNKDVLNIYSPKLAIAIDDYFQANQGADRHYALWDALALKETHLKAKKKYGLTAGEFKH